MKFLLIPAACLILIFSSCKKDSNSANNIVKASVDGADVNFSINANAHIITNEPGAYPNVLVINGTTGTGSNKAIITIDVSSENLIKNGTFPSSDTSPGPVSFSEIIYEQTTPGSQIAQPYITNNFVQGSTTVTISSISSTNVQGTFSGALVYSINGTGEPAKTIANGVFNLTIN
jgi:hypothetical protein